MLLLQLLLLLLQLLQQLQLLQLLQLVRRSDSSSRNSLLLHLQQPRSALLLLLPVCCSLLG